MPPVLLLTVNTQLPDRARLARLDVVHDTRPAFYRPYCTDANPGLGDTVSPPEHDGEPERLQAIQHVRHHGMRVLLLGLIIPTVSRARFRPGSHRRNRDHDRSALAFPFHLSVHCNAINFYE